MKKYLYIFLFCLLAVSASAQNSAVRDIQVLPVCWAASGLIDSSLYAYWLMSSRDEVPSVVSYLNVTGQKVDISGGGAISSGNCCCNGSGGGTTVTITDNNDGTYTAVVGGVTTVIDTIAATNTTISIPISISDTTYLSGSNIQELLSSFSSEINQLRSRTGCDLKIGQVAHGFPLGSLLTQDSGTGVYSLASADDAANFPVAYVCSIISVDSFYVDTEGWVSDTHGQTVYQDYFLQDVAGTVATTSGSFPIFAWRTFSPTLRYYDIPEYVADGSVGGGDADWYEVGTTSPPNNIGDDQFTNGNVGINQSVPTQALHISGRVLFESFGIHDIGSNSSNMGLSITDGSGGYQGIAQLNRDGGGGYWFSILANTGFRIFDGSDFIFENEVGNIQWKNSSNTLTSRIYHDVNDRINVFGERGISLDAAGLTSGDALYLINNVPNYANDAAADADATLLSNGVYTVTVEDRSLRIKP